VKSERRPSAPSKGSFLLIFRKNYPSASLLSKAASAELRARAGSARDAVTDAAHRAMAGGTRKARAGGARFAASRPAQLTAGIAAAAAIGTLAAAAPWTSAAASTADVARSGHVTAITSHAPAITSHTTADQAAAKAVSSQPETIYDSVAPTAIPAGQHVATYADGPFQASSASVAGRGSVLWIDTNGTNTHANALDVEPGDATPAEAASWVSAKLSASPHSDAIVYTFLAEWGPVQSNINALPSWMQSLVKYWIANPTGTPHIVPGAAATQWYWGSSYDISMAQPGFFN
jgi:hypothetical protein